MRPKRLTQFLMLAGSLALAIAQGIVLLVILLIMAWLHGEPQSKLVSLRLGGRMKEKDRWERFADSTRYAAIPLRASNQPIQNRLSRLGTGSRDQGSGHHGWMLHNTIT